MDCNSVLPDDMLLQIFQYLDVESLGAVAAVSTDWERVQKMKAIWKQLCLQYISEDALCLPQASNLKERFKILNRLITGKAHKQVIKECYKARHKEHAFGFFHGIPIEVRPNINTSYVVMPCIPDQIGTTRLFEGLRVDITGEPVCINLHGNDCIVIDNHGNLISYDLTTTESTQFIDPDERGEKLVKEAFMCVSEDEIVSCMNKDIIIWNRKTRTVKNKISYPGYMGSIVRLEASNNHIICKSYFGTEDYYSVIPKDAKAIDASMDANDILGAKIFMRLFAASGSLIAAFTEKQLLIFKENNRAIEIAYRINFSTLRLTFSGNLGMVQIWLTAGNSCSPSI